MIQQKGFNLIELMVALACIGLSLFFTATSYQWLMDKNQSRIAINQLISAVNFARVEAMHRHQVVTLCASLDGRQCFGEWQDGMLIFVDQNTNDISANQRVEVLSAFPKGSQVTWNRGRHYIQFGPNGYLNSQNGTFIYCLHKIALALVVSLTGRIRISAIDNSVC